MNKTEFHHVVRAAGAILNVEGVLVIGSQAVHGSLVGNMLPGDQSMEADIALPGEDADHAADLIDGAIGEGSLFHETHGYYGHGVTERTAKLPDGWRNRLIPHRAPDTNGVTAHCLDPHDLWMSKAAAGREKDATFCRAMVNSGLVDAEILLERLRLMRDIHPLTAEKVRGWITQFGALKGNAP